MIIINVILSGFLHILSGLEPISNLNKTPALFMVPAIQEGTPKPGIRVRQQWPEEAGTKIHHALYLPLGEKPAAGLPVIVEFAGNGGFKNQLGDESDGTVEGCILGYGITRGKDAIWVCVPFVDSEHKQNATNWWGNPEATVEYTIRTVERVCKQHGGDKNRVFLAGFSRGSIACSYIGLRNEKISGLWGGFICHSHLDGVRKWNYADSDAKSALSRWSRLNNRPVFISHEGSAQAARDFLETNKVQGRFTFVNLPFPNHTAAWVLRDLPETRQLRDWWRKHALLKD
jgi:hypothetical protein